MIFGLRLHRALTLKPPPGLGELQRKTGIPVDVFIAKPQEFSDEILVTGTTGSEEEANISPKIGGRVILVNAEPGMSVKRKQILVVIDEHLN